MGGMARPSGGRAPALGLCFPPSIITFADLDLNKEDIGLGGSPTKVKSTATKQFDKTIETLELDPESAAKAIVDALKERHLI